MEASEDTEMRLLSAQTPPAAPKHALQPVASAAAPTAHAPVDNCSYFPDKAGTQQQHPPVGASLCSHDPQSVHHSGHAKVSNLDDAAVVH